MRKTKRLMTIVMALVLSLGAFTSLGCSSSEEMVRDGKTVNVKLYSAGYGTNYIYALKEQFEETYKEQGYKLNIFTPRAGFTGELFLQDIAGDTGADVYFGNGITEKLLSMAEYANTVEDITELVANKKPINFKGEEEGEKTIAQKIDDCTYSFVDYKRADGSYHAIPFNIGVRGLAVNVGVLNDYELEIPKTSNEFFNCYNVIMADAEETGIFPITHIATSNNYPVSFTSGWMAQYEGQEWYEKFFSFENDDGSNMTKDQALAMFNADGIKYMLEGMYRALDPNCATYGSETQGLEKAQAKFMNGECAFMMNGDWLLEETYSNFSDKQRENITFVAVPVISELGIKVFGSGTAYNKSEADCEKILRAIIDEVDANKALADIKVAVDAKLSMDINVDDIKTVASARGFAYPETISESIIISAKSEVKDIAALLLRMCASEEGGRLIATETHSTSPYTSEYEVSRYEWVNSARKIITNQYFWGVRPSASGFRKTLHANFADFFPLTGTFINLTIVGEGVTIYSSDGKFDKIKQESLYKTSAEDLQQRIYNDVKDNYTW